MDIGSLTGAITIEDALSSILLQASSKVQRFADDFDGAMGDTQASMTRAGTVASFLGNALSSYAMQAISWGKNLVTSSLMAGARLEQLGVATRFLGEKAGYSGPYVDELAKKIEASGISGIATREAIQSLLGAHIDLAKASELSAIAQNMQSLSGRSSSEVFEVMTRALATGNTEILRGIGFQTISLEGLKAQNKELTGYTGVLSAAQRTQMIMNAMIAEGSDKMGLYGESMKTAGKQASSAERAWDQVSEQIGTVLLPLTNVAIKSWYKMGEAVRDAVKSSGGSVAEFVRSASVDLQKLITKTGELVTMTVEGGIKIYKAYDSLPSVIKRFNVLVLEAALAVWALNAAMTYLAATKLGWVVAYLSSQMAIFGIEVGVVTTAKYLWHLATVRVMGVVKALWVVVAAHPLVAVTAAVGALTLALVAWKQAAADAAVASQTAGAIQDTINLAISRNAEKTISYTDAIEYNRKFVEAAQPTHVKLAKAQDAAAEASERMKKSLDQMRTSSLEPLTAAQKAYIIEADKHHKSVEDIVKVSGASEDAIKTLLEAQKKATKTSDDYTDAVKEISAAQIPLTASQMSSVIAWEKQGIAAGTMAKVLRISSEAISEYLEGVERAKKAEKEWADVRKDWAKQAHGVVTGLADDYIKEQKRIADESGKAQSAQLAAAVDYQEKNKQFLMSGTALKLRQIDLEEIAARNALRSQSGMLGILTAEQTAYYQHQRDIASGTASTLIERMRSAGVATRAELRATALRAVADYDQMIATSDQWSKAAIKHQKKVADAAVHAADDTKSAWDKTYNAFGNVADILDNISGKFAEIGSMAAKGAQAVMSNLAEGDTIGAIISGAVAAIGIITKLVGWANEGRKAVVAFAESFDTMAAGTGFDELRGRLDALGDAGVVMWKKLTQMTGSGDVAGAKRIIDEIKAALEFTPEGFGYKTIAELQMIADKTKVVYEYMVSSGKYTAAAIADAFQKSKDAQIAALGGEAEAHQKAMDEITARYDEMFSEIDSRYKTLSDSVADEAKEAVMGVIETQQRAEMVKLEADRAALEEKKRLELLTAEETYAAWLEAGKTADEALRELFAKGYDSPIRFHPERLEEPAYMASGGVVPFTPRGTDTVPAMLTPGETVTPAGRSGRGGTAIIKINGRTLAEVIVPELPGVVQEYGLG